MRDKISEILSTFRFTEQSGHPLSIEDARLQLADFLIQHRVLAYPVKPGDTVYVINHHTIKEWKVYFVGMNMRGEVKFNVVDDRLTSTHEFWDYNIGVCVFLTEEDAINELKERKSYERAT